MLILSYLLTLQVSTEYHLCNLNDVHHRSPGKSFLQPLLSLRGLVGSDRWQNMDDLQSLDPNYSSSVHVSRKNSKTPTTDANNFGGIENSVDTSWSFQVRKESMYYINAMRCPPRKFNS